MYAIHDLHSKSLPTENRMRANTTRAAATHTVFRPKVSRALRESSATRPERSTDRPPVNVRLPLNEDPNVVYFGYIQ